MTKAETEAKTALDTITKNAKDEATLNNIFVLADNKATIEAYFSKSGGTTYETPAIDGKTYTIIQDKTNANDIKYTVTPKA